MARGHRRQCMVMFGVALVASASMPPAAATTPAVPYELAFASGDWSDGVDVFVTDTTAAYAVRVAEGPVGVYAAPDYAWSPDGSRIAFVSSRTGTPRLAVVFADGTGERLIGDGPVVSGAGIAWSSDGSRIAYVSHRNGNDELYVADAASGLVTNLSTDPSRTGKPVWSPDGTRLAYISRDEAVPQDDVYVVAVGGGAPVNVTADAADRADFAWSPDGAHLAFVAARDGNAEVYVADADGGNQVNLTHDPADDTSPAWSPDGTMIAYSSGLGVYRPESGWEILVPSRIYLMDADGGNRRAMTDGSIDPEVPDRYELASTSPAWSPDGSRLAVLVTGHGPSPHAGFFDLYVVDVAGVEPARLVAQGAGGAAVRWSPDGTRLAVYEAGNYGIDAATSVVPAAGGPVAVLAAGAGVGSAQWSPDGSQVLYGSAGMAARSDVFVAAPDGSAPRNLTAGRSDPVNGFATWRPQPLGPVGLVDPDTGRWHVRDQWGWQRSFYYGDPGDVPFLGDWDCDGEATPGLYRQADGYVYLRNSNSQGVADLRFYFGDPGDIPLAGDFDGDGCDTVSVYRPSEGRVFVINVLGSQERGLGSAEVDYYFGDPGDKPFVGDFDGDGVDTVGLHRESTGLVYVRQSHTEGIADAEFYFGDPGDRIVAGDWTGDGVDTVGIFRPAEHRFYLSHTNESGPADQHLWMGRSGWIPITGAVTPPG